MKKILILGSVVAGLIIATPSSDAWNPFAKKATATQTIAQPEAVSKAVPGPAQGSSQEVVTSQAAATQTTPAEQEKAASYMAEKSQEMKTQHAKRTYEKELKEDKAAAEALVKAQSDVIREQQETADAKLAYETEEAKLAKIQAGRSAAATLKTEQKAAADKVKLDTKIQNMESKNTSKQIELQLAQMRDLFKTKNKISNPFSKELKAYDEKVKTLKQTLQGNDLVEAVKTLDK